MRSYISGFDFILLTETFSTCFPAHIFPLHHVFVSSGVRLGLKKSLIIRYLLVRRRRKTPTNNSFGKHVRVEFHNCVTLELLKELTVMTVDCVLIGTYLPPSQSC